MKNIQLLIISLLTLSCIAVDAMQTPDYTVKRWVDFEKIDGGWSTSVTEESPEYLKNNVIILMKALADTSHKNPTTLHDLHLGEYYLRSFDVTVDHKENYKTAQVNMMVQKSQEEQAIKHNRIKIDSKSTARNLYKDFDVQETNVTVFVDGKQPQQIKFTAADFKD